MNIKSNYVLFLICDMQKLSLIFF